MRGNTITPSSKLGKTLDLNPNFALAHRLLAIAYERKGKYDEAAAENQIWGDLTNDRPPGLRRRSDISLPCREAQGMPSRFFSSLKWKSLLGRIWHTPLH